MNKRRFLVACCSAALAVPLAAAAPSQEGMAKSTESAAWPQVPRPAVDAPSVLLIMTDDVGFGASSTFGGPVDTPTFDSLANTGLRYNNMTTAGICSPTRAALLTGRNHHAVNVGNVVDAASGFDGYTSVIPKSAATGARLLADAGYSTAMFGKGHVTPLWETGPTGPFDRWPTGLGFQYFYGFLGGDTNQWAPAIYENTTPVEPPTNDPHYILDQALADKAVGWLRKQSGANPGKPFFVYYAPGTAHAPHHAPPEWIARYKGRFDQGWDVIREHTLARQKALGVIPADTKLAARPDMLPAWNSLSAQQRRVYAREMEAYAGALSFADHEIGRVIAEARQQAGGNLLVVYVQGDNGASAEAGLNGTLNEHQLFQGLTDDIAVLDARLADMGGPNAMNHYSAGWAFAMNAPFPWFKQLASHYGATRNGVVINWLKRIGPGGEVRSQFHHIIDVMPTILEAAKVSPPNTVDGVEQAPLDGVSMTYSFDRSGEPSHRRTQYYNVWDNMAVYQGGWVAASVPGLMPWIYGPAAAVPAHIEGRKWNLYDTRHDFSESNDLSAKYPGKLRDLQSLFFAEAARNKALPIHRYEGTRGRPNYNAGTTKFRFTGPVARIPEDVAPPLSGRSFELTAKVDLSQVDTDGSLVSLGGRFGGLAWYVLNGRLVFQYNLAGQKRTTIVAAEPLTTGPHTLGLRFNRMAGWHAPATVTLVVDGRPVATGTIDKTVSLRFSLDETFDIGSDTGTPVSDTYQSPNVFTGKIEEIVVDTAKTK